MSWRPASPGTWPSTDAGGRAIRTNRSATDRPTAIRIPASTSNTRTPNSAASASPSSDIRNLPRRRSAATSIRRSAANTTIPPSAALGMYEINPGTARTTTTTAAAATRPVTWLWARTASTIAVRDPEALSAKPPVRPDADVGHAKAQELAVGVDDLAGPDRERAPGERDVRVGDESDRRRRPGQRGHVTHRQRGQRDRRQAARNRPDERDAARREIEDVDDDRRADDRDQRPRRQRCDALEDQQERRYAEAEDDRCGLHVTAPCPTARPSSRSPRPTSGWSR